MMEREVGQSDGGALVREEKGISNGPGRGSAVKRDSTFAMFEGAEESLCAGLSAAEPGDLLIGASTQGEKPLHL